VTFCLVGEEVIDFTGGTVVSDNGKTFVVHVEDQILTLWQSLHLVAADTCSNHYLTMTARPIRPISPLEEMVRGT